MSRFLLPVLVAVAGLCAYPVVGSSCSPGDGTADVAAGGRPKLHPLAEWCVDYVLEGMMQGTWKECGREHGYERFELQNVEIKIGGFSQSDKKRVVYLEDEIYTIKPGGATTQEEGQDCTTE